MLDKTSKKFLKLAIRKSRILHSSEIEIPVHELKQAPSKVNTLCDYLYTNGYISEYTPCYDMHDSIHFCLTYKGEHCFEFEWIEVKEFLFKSFLIPLLVSFFTTLITLFLKSLC